MEVVVFQNADGLTRRQSLKTAAAFMILPAGLARGYAANGKLNLGIIGVSGIGGVNAKTFKALGHNIAALCDVDSRILDKRGAEYPEAKRYSDFRKMIEREKLDGVIVATPDHTHTYISVWAMKHGLHVYCQKPLTQTVEEARIIARVAEQTKVITQMGTQPAPKRGSCARSNSYNPARSARSPKFTCPPIAPSGRRAWNGRLARMPSRLSLIGTSGSAPHRRVPSRTSGPTVTPSMTRRARTSSAPAPPSITRSPGAAGSNSAAAHSATSRRTA
jgi:hypothetical protein